MIYFDLSGTIFFIRLSIIKILDLNFSFLDKIVKNPVVKYLILEKLSIHRVDQTPLGWHVTNREVHIAQPNTCLKPASS